MGFLKWFERKPKSKDVAKERLKLVLVHDRADISPKFLEMIKSDILQVLAKYAEIDQEALDIELTRVETDGDQYATALVANIPIKQMREIGKNSVK